MQDMRLIELTPRASATFGVKELVGTIITGAILVMIGLYVHSKVAANVDVIEGGHYVNSSVYCPSAGTWNGTACNGATLTAVPAEYVTQESIKSNVLSGFDLSSVVFIVLAAAGIIGIIWLAFR